MLQGKTGTQLRLKLLHNVRFWACVILTPQMSRKYSLFLSTPPPWFGICGWLNAPGSCNVLRERQRALAEYLTGENPAPVFCKCASCILKMTPYRDHAKKNKTTALLFRKKQNLWVQWFPCKQPRSVLHFKTHQNKTSMIKILTYFWKNTEDVSSCTPAAGWMPWASLHMAPFTSSLLLSLPSGWHSTHPPAPRNS